MVKVWCKFEQNSTKAIEVIEQKPQMLTEFRNHGITESWNHRITDMLKTVYPPKTLFCRGYNYPGSLFFSTDHSKCGSGVVQFLYGFNGTSPQESFLIPYGFVWL